MNKQEVLIITSYFPPETGAASNRIFALATQLKSHNYKVSVISPLPNYPHGKVFDKYRGKFVVKENFKGVALTRLFIFASKSTNKIIRLFSILSFAFYLFFFLLFTKTPNRYIIQCSPLFVGYFATLAGKIKSKTIILNVSDLWPLAGLEMGILSKGFYYNILEYMESFIYKNSSKVIGQSEEILKHVKSKIPKQHKTLFLYRNFPDFNTDFITENTNENEFRFVYAGLIGVAQGIEEICKKVNFPKGSSFHIYGGGPMAEDVKKISHKKERIFYKGSLSREELHKTLVKYDATIIPLKNRIYGSVPSKIFEYSKLGLPILFFSDGEGADIVENLGLGVTQRKIDYKELEEKIVKIVDRKIKLSTKENVLKLSRKHFNIKKQFKEFEKQCLA